MVLPEESLALLHELASHVRHRATVYQPWGFGAAGQRGLGISALFTGPVTANLVDVILRTRIPIDRLVDWLDQALLYLHVPPESGQRLPRAELRALGIRTATDVERAWASTDQDARRSGRSWPR